MVQILKIIGAVALVILLIFHVALVTLFFTPNEKLMAMILPKDAVVLAVSDIPDKVQQFIAMNKISLETDLYGDNSNVSKLVLKLLQFRLERTMSDSEKLAMQMTLLPFGEEIVGLPAASRYYFKKPLSNISEAQWITLINLQKIFKK